MAASAEALTYAIASIVTIGPMPEADGNADVGDDEALRSGRPAVVVADRAHSRSAHLVERVERDAVVLWPTASA